MIRSELGADEAKGSVFGDQQNRSSGWGDSMRTGKGDSSEELETGWWVSGGVCVREEEV